MIESDKIICPRCGKETKELLNCEVCNTIGCTRCIVKFNKQWICEKCKGSTPESIFSMFK